MHIGYVLLGSFPRINYLGSIILFKFATLNSINQFYDEKINFKMTSVLVVSLIILSSCASILSKSTYPLSINSNPNNAKVSITDKRGKEIFLGLLRQLLNLKLVTVSFPRQNIRCDFQALATMRKLYQ
ncbi:hypothetical protein SDC9_52679 [bioreactor metagenome]|uniref:Uncharacterized protein n=1 Tax=bioreactor metagenome TaxID=1076179 RepID=A0A644WRC1_9ZZZZ